MVYGAAATGTRVMTASSGPGLSLMQEGISYLAGAELPCVIVDIMRGGPGLGNLGPEQGDYFQMVKGGGHGNYRTIVLAPNSGAGDVRPHHEELSRLPIVSQSGGRDPGRRIHRTDDRRPVTFPDVALEPPVSDWAVQGNAQTRSHWISSIYLRHEDLEVHVNHLEEKYTRAESCCVLFEGFQLQDAEILLVGYGVVSRILHSVVELGRAHGVKLGLLRPISLWPFPKRELKALVPRGSRLCWCAN